MDDAPLPLTLIADPLERAMAFVETNAFEPLTLDDLADVASLSPYHFARQFNARYGLTPMAFVRARRLGLAARLLAGPHPPSLVNLAFDTGFETQEGFTRAFKRAFGVSPGRYRKSRVPTPMQILSTSDLAKVPRLTQSPAPVRKPGFRVAGIGGVFDETTRPQIPGLWRRLEARLPIAQFRGGTGYGASWAAQGSEGCFHYMASVEIDADAPAPEGLDVKDVPEQTYLIFRQVTDGTALQPQIVGALQEIWGERVPRSGYKLARGPDLEVCPPGYRPDRACHFEWWIPVEA